MKFNPDDWLEIGKIVAPQGLRGEMRVYPTTDFPERFLHPGERWLLKQGGSTLEVIQLIKGRLFEGKGLYVIMLKGITTREQAEQLRNSRLWVPESDRLPLEEGEFHVADLVGLSVYHHTTGDYIGDVIDVLSAGHDILEVRQPSSHPATQHIEQNVEPSCLINQNDVTLVCNDAQSPNANPQRHDAHENPHKSNPQHQTQRSESKSNRKKSKNKKSKSTQKPPSILIPFVHDIAPIVDLDRQRIEVLPPKGLIDTLS